MCQLKLDQSLLGIKTIKWTMACAPGYCQLLLLCRQSEDGIHCAAILACQSASTVEASQKPDKTCPPSPQTIKASVEGAVYSQ